MRTILLLALSLSLGAATAPPAAATPAGNLHEPAATPAMSCAGDSVRIEIEAPCFDFAATDYTVTFTERSALAWPVTVRDTATLPTGYKRIAFRVRPVPKLVKVPLIYRGYMKRAYGRGWHPDFAYVAAPAYRAYTYLSWPSAYAGLTA